MPERRMTDTEALMWSFDDDPALRSSFVSVTFLDGPPDFARFRRRVEDAIAAMPSLRERVVPGRLTPRWAADPTFDLDYHVRRVAAPAPATRRQVLDLAEVWAADPFDRDRPLWQFTIVEGLDGDEAALVAKMHHVLSDGVGAVRISAAFLDLSPDGDDLAAPEPDQDTASGGFSAVLGEAARRVEGLAGTVRHPERVVSIGRSLVRQAGVVEPSRSPLWTGRRSYQHRFEARSFDLDEVRATAKALGGTVNDVFVTAVAGAAGAYHRARGEDVAELRMSMPVSTRHDRKAGGNAWAPTRVLVPVRGEARSRFVAVHTILDATKREPSLSLTQAFAGVARRLPPPVLLRLAHQQVNTVDFACSNVRGAPFDLWIGGARVLANHPMGPTAGTAFNATVLSYRDQLDLGLNADAGALDAPAELAGLIADGLEELAEASR